MIMNWVPQYPECGGTDIGHALLTIMINKARYDGAESMLRD